MSVHPPGHMFKGPKWKVALYLDEKADNDQTDALTMIFTGQAGGDFFAEIVPIIGEILGIESVPIEFIIEGKKRRKIKIPYIVEMEIEGLAGNDPNVESKSCQSSIFKYFRLWCYQMLLRMSILDPISIESCTGKDDIYLRLRANRFNVL